MNDLYSPHTGEHIQTDTPADWMGRAGTAAPTYTPGAESAFWRGAAWEVVSAEPARPSKEQRISMLQDAYDSDRDKLNRAWLSAMIADGVEETTRKTAIEGEMTALDAQLEVDILTIIMEA